MTDTDAILSATNLRKNYHRGSSILAADKSSVFAAVDDVTFEISPRETFAIVGESGCGKTTLARMLLRLIEPDSGKIMFAGRDFTAMRGPDLQRERRHLQMVFQDPYASLNPRMRVGEIVAEPLAIHEPALSREERRERVTAILRRVGLNQEFAARYPHEFSGGQRQRIGIARALILQPKLIVADEPVSALDVSVAAQMLVLLQDLQREFGLTYLLISHSLPVVAQVATHIAVMRAGKFVELGPAEQILRSPQHAYTQELLAAVPELPTAAA